MPNILDRIDKITEDKRRRNFIRIFRFVGLLFFLYLFLLSIELLGISLKTFGKDFIADLFAITENPFIGLFIGILSTSIIQSSSATTSIVVGLVAAGAPLRGAVPIIMGANIGTTVTNTMVSMAHITRPTEFRRAYPAAIIHDAFNLLTVIVLLPTEYYTHYLEHSAYFFRDLFSGVGGMKLISPLKLAVYPTADLIYKLIRSLFDTEKITAIIGIIISVILLFIALAYLVKLLKKLVIGKVERILHDYLFARPLRSLVIGIVITSTIQSSSVSTSLIVPLVGAGILTLEQIFPYTIGANIGTTITAILASFVTQSPEAIAVAFVHLLFNISGTIIWYPLKIVPITYAKFMGELTYKRRWIAVAYLAILFYILPFVLICFTHWR